jgi:hypothetical protein
MKKLITLALLALTTMVVQAQSRKTWDFLNNGFSAATITALQTDMDQNGTGGYWRDWEKDVSTANTGTWFNASTVSGTASTHVDGVVTPIPELKDLNFQSVKGKGLVLVNGYSQSENDGSPNKQYPYGTHFIWLNGSGLSFTFKAAAGDTLHMGIESHKNTEARGVNISVNGTTIAADYGQSVPIFFNDVKWTLPQATDGSDSVTVKVTSSNGCHIYYIIVGEGDAPTVKAASKIAYVFNSGNGYDREADYAHAFISGSSDLFTTTAVDVNNKTITADSLEKFDAVVISPYIDAADACVSTLKSIIAYEPVLNLNASLYEPWGYGKAVTTIQQTATIVNVNNKFFTNATANGLDTSTGALNILSSGGITGVNLSPYFAGDDTLAVVDNAVAVHEHNANRNAYMFLPYDKQNMASIDVDAMSVILPTALSLVADTKTAVTNTPVPTVSQVYKNKETLVVLKDGNKSATIYYTTDGTDPSNKSNVYTDTLKFIEPVTIKAIAKADGYLMSDTAIVDIAIKTQAPAPEFTINEGADTSVVTLTDADPSLTIYYNYTGSTDATKSAVYFAPLKVTTPVTVTVFAEGGSYIQSETASKNVTIQNIDKTLRYDVLAHFDANSVDWNHGSTSTAYFFSWGKTARSCYDTTQSPDVNGVYPFVPDEEISDSLWTIKSKGQVVDWENTTPTAVVGDGTGYNPETAEDAILADNEEGATKAIVNLGDRIVNEPYTANIESKYTYAGPFDVIVYAANGNGSSVPKCDIETSTDGTSWTKLDSVSFSNTRRLWKRTKMTYSGTTPVYVRLAQTGGGSKAMIFDIYILNQGDKTKGILDNINDIDLNVTPVTRTEIYSLSGMRLSSLQSGINIVRTVYANGAVKVKKVLIK